MFNRRSSVITTFPPGRRDEQGAGMPAGRAAIVAPAIPEALTAAVLDSITDPLAVINNRGTVLLTNRAWRESRQGGGIAESATVGANVLDLCRHDTEPSAARAVKGIRSVLSGSSDGFRLECSHRSPSVRRWAMVHVLPLRRQGGGAVIIRSDTTRQRTAQRQVRALSRLLIAAQERERTWIARELHDDVTQQLAAAALDLSILAAQIPAESPAQDEAGRIAERLRKLCTHVHGLSRRMHPHALETLGLSQAIATECREFAQRTGIGMATEIQEIDRTLPAQTATAAFRIFQEALNNVEKHARATSVRVMLALTDEELTLRITDTGVGFNVSRPRAGIGLSGMRERALAIGGRISISSAPGHGATVKLTRPLHNEAHP